MRWHPYRMWRITIRETHAYADVEIEHSGGLFGVWVYSYDLTHMKLREEWEACATLREAKSRGEAMAVELLKHAAQALGVA